jgi:hypothetical protein
MKSVKSVYRSIVQTFNLPMSVAYQELNVEFWVLDVGMIIKLDGDCMTSQGLDPP